MPRSLPRACQKAFTAATLLVLLSACLSPEMDIELTEDLLCERSEQCPNGLSCVGGVCVGLGQCGDGIVQSGEVCDDGDANSDAYALARHCNALCQGYVEEYCGDGIVQSEFEVCDDGNETLNDRCPDGPQGTCQWAICGDGHIFEGVESCEPQSAEAQTCTDLSDTADNTSYTCNDTTCSFQPSDCFESPNGFVYLLAGSFEMGSPEGELGRESDEAQRTVTLTYDFFLGATEVTLYQWRSIMGSLPTREACPTQNCPVHGVSFWDALAYANALSEQYGYQRCYDLSGCTGTPGDDYACTGMPVFLDSEGTANSSPYRCRGYRLPTEAEWEYAYRAGTTTMFYTGDSTQLSCSEAQDPLLSQAADYCESSVNFGGETTGAKRANAWGLYDMAGGYAELVSDQYVQSPEFSENPHPNGTLDRCVRGGDIKDAPSALRAASRDKTAPSNRSTYRSFRIARTVRPETAPVIIIP